MDQFRVPVVQRAVRIRAVDGQVVTGCIFLPALAPGHEGPMHVDEWINHADMFFPLAVDGDKRGRVINKHHVLDLTLLSDTDSEIECCGLPREVVVECGALRVEGTVYVDMPEHASRLLDWVNQPSAFILVRDADGIHFIQKRAITFIAEKAGR